MDIKNKGNKRKSSAVKLGLVTTVATAAITLVGCSQNQDAVCVDKNDTVVESKFCEEQGRNHRSGMAPFYYWYLFSRGGRYPYGTRVSGGTRFVPGSTEAISSGHPIISGRTGSGSRSIGSVPRGGFGSSGISRGIGA